MYRFGMIFVFALLVLAGTTKDSVSRERGNDPSFPISADAMNAAVSNSAYLQRQEVPFELQYPAGTIIVDTKRFVLYFVEGDSTAIRYGIGVGRSGFTWAGAHTISRKAEWPGWTPPAEMRLRQPWLPSYVPGGPDNPLGARALYIGSTLYRIHGTNEAQTIGHAVSSGCIRMLNKDVIDLYDRVRIGAKVVVL